jgi:hypothetical protein
LFHIEDSPRVYVSTNPWKITATFQTISSTREEYIATIDSLKAALPNAKEGSKRPKTEVSHAALIQALESRLEAIDIELNVRTSELVETTRTYQSSYTVSTYFSRMLT